MLFNVSGSQGQGKSTVLASLSDLGYNVVPNKTARTILAELNLTLPQVYASPVLTMNFQYQVLQRHAETCTEYASDPDNVYFIERSYADIFSYALAILGPHNQYNDWLNDYYEKCLTLQKEFAGSFYLTGRQAIVQDDGVRSTNIHFSELMDFAIKKYVMRFSEVNGTFSYVVDTPSHEERIKRITEIVKAIV